MSGNPQFLPREDFSQLLDALTAAGFCCIGPTVRDGAIVYEPIASVADLPLGVRDDQQPGRYRLGENSGGRYFAWANGPQALKPLTFKPRELLWTSERGADGAIRFTEATSEAQQLAVIGVRACDLAALYLHDKHFLHGHHPDPSYTTQRERLFLVAVHCTHPSSNCFCVSTGDGPRAGYGYDLALSELDEGFLVEAKSRRAGEILAQVPLRDAEPGQIEAAEEELNAGAKRQTKNLPSRNLRDVLFARLEHPRWREVAERCLACGNCTQVCPTCFCHKETEQPNLEGTRSEHGREWDSCFTQGHSYIHGITLRPDTHTRYRQWLTHKLGGWHEQFGRSGCVGCGRCITWCPVGIDLTEEVAVICR